MPNTSCVYQKIANQKQAADRLRFAAVVLYARDIMSDPVNKNQ
ncbi:MAG: hypothetical protein ABI402_07745 [Ferruginibacter sp.]